MNLVEKNIDKITDLCRRHKVKSLSAFGSVLTDRFSESSDVDFLVNFNADHNDFDYVENYFNLKDALENVLGRSVDLLEEKALKNRFFIANVNRTKKLIYG
jgi:predicted nucleotidyltransferase